MKKRTMKRTISLVLALVIALSVGVLAATTTKQITAYYGTVVTVNGKILDYTYEDGTKAQIFAVNGVTYVPIRAAAEALGLKIGWDYDSKAVTLNSPSVVTGPASAVGDVLYDNNGVRITYKGMQKSSSWIGGYEILLLIENSSDENWTVQIRDFSLNGYMCSPVCSSGVAAGKKINDNILIMESDIEKNEISTPLSAEFKFNLFDTDTWGNDIESNIITINF